MRFLRYAFAAALAASLAAGCAQKAGGPEQTSGADAGKPHIVALDYGMKWNIARHLFDMGCRVTILPGTATASEVLDLEPDGVFLSNGPGDPEPVVYAQETIRSLLGKKPIFGICLGHQLLCLAAGGRTCGELALMGLPSRLCVLAENQRANAEGMQAAGAAHNLGWHRDVSSVTLAGEMERLLLSREVREAMARTGQRLVDGYGALRVVAELSGGVVVRVRPAEQADVRLVFEWANDPLTRAMSFHPEPISWAEHERWFRRAMSTAALLFLIVEVEEGEAWTPCCQVRIDQDGTVSISIAPGYRSRGLAVPALRAAMVHSRQRGRRELKAFIKPENERSQKIFCQAGFEPVGEAEISGQRCLAYIYRYPQGAAARNE